ncbi:hypothetical protein ACEN2A_07825 [Corynebacterium auriscanis]|uniref:hypothetical protein n=1 Tax=Corynebacterium auriscanis TaxID=99807 RepID=UPI003CF39370
MKITQRPQPWTDEALVETRRKALTSTYGNDPDVLDMIEKQIEIRALARDSRTARSLVEQLKATVKQQRGADAATRKQLQAAKQLNKQLTARLQELDGKAALHFPGGNVLPGSHAQTSTPAGDSELLDGITDDEVDAMFPPLT